MISQFKPSTHLLFVFVLIGCSTNPILPEKFIYPRGNWKQIFIDANEEKLQNSEGEIISVKNFSIANSEDASALIQSRIFAYSINRNADSDPYFHKVDRNCTKKIWQEEKVHTDFGNVSAAITTESTESGLIVNCKPTSNWIKIVWLYCKETKEVVQFTYLRDRSRPKPDDIHFSCKAN